MITNFEELTESLTDQEKELLPNLATILHSSVGKEHAITQPEICRLLDGISGSTLRKLIHYMRATDYIKFYMIIATSCGYYLSNDANEMERQVQSIKDRISALQEIESALITTQNRICHISKLGQQEIPFM